MAKKENDLFYTGAFLETPQIVKRKIWDDKEEKEIEVEEKIDPYLPDPDLVDAINLAIFLERPLLLMGEPGCGKTRVAEAVAGEFFHREPDFRQFFYEWHIKSTTKAREGLYEYDAIRRLGEAQVNRQSGQAEALNIKHFIELGPMAKAFSHKDPHKRPVLLIDEIDKADLDFPNDLLRELDKGVFHIPELKKTIRATVKPIIIITSNQEKPLPDAFLRRCIYHYIDPLGAELLKRILRHIFYKKDEVKLVEKMETLKDEKEEQFLNKAVRKFLDIREEVKSKESILGKNVSTSELIDWFRILLHYRNELEDNRAVLEEKEAHEAREILGHSYQLLRQMQAFEQDLDTIPFLQVLFKDFKTMSNFKKQQSQ